MKHYRDFTVGELLDMGFNVNALNHDCPSKDEANNILSMFAGVKKSSGVLESGIEVLLGRKEKFEVVNFIKEG